MGRQAAVALLLVLPALLLPGCLYGEDIHVAMRVPAGTTTTLTGDRLVEGSLLVEEGATLVLEGARLVVAQSLLVEGGRVVARDSEMVFAGPFARHELDVRGDFSAVRTTLVGVAELRLRDGRATFDDGEAQALHLGVLGGSLESQGTRWTLGPSRHGGFHGHSMLLADGAATFSGGSVRVVPGSQGAGLGAGVLKLENLTWSAEGARGAVFEVDVTTVEARGVTFQTEPFADFLALNRGVFRLVDSPLPREARYPSVSPEGALVVAWTLEVEAVTPPGGIPVAGLNVTLASAHAPDAADTVATDDEGVARFVAVQYVLAGKDSRPGNPHLATADEGGKRGATPALVVERPTRVTMLVT